MSGVIPIVFAMLLIYFIITYDWGKSKMPGWVPYLFVVVLFFYIINGFLLILNINLFEQIKNKEVLETILQKIKN